MAKLGSGDRPGPPVSGSGGAQSPDTAVADILAVGGTSRRTYNVPARGCRRDPQLGLSVCVATGREHRHRCFLSVGKIDETRSFLGWLLHASRLQRPSLPALFTLTGCHVPLERELTGWRGYAASKPVRVGNGAANQHQLDGYGWVLDAAWLLVLSGHRLYSETWRTMRGFADFVARRWQEPGAGIWEIRGDAAHHVHSKLMGWLALDRALRIGESHHLGHRQRERWQSVRDDMAQEIRSKGFNSDIGSYTRSYGSADLDSALLVLPLLGFEDAASSRVTGQSTLSGESCPQAVRFSIGTLRARTDCPALKAPFCRVRFGWSRLWLSAGGAQKRLSSSRIYFRGQRR